MVVKNMSKYTITIKNLMKNGFDFGLQDYQIFDAFGRLVYIGRESVLSLPRGVYVVVIGNEVQKIVL